MMLADERFFVAELVEPFDQLQVAFEAERWVSPSDGTGP